jgi:hypothetical protein
MFVAFAAATTRRAQAAMVFLSAARQSMLAECVGATASLALVAMEFRRAEKSLTHAACAGATTLRAPAATVYSLVIKFVTAAAIVEALTPRAISTTPSALLVNFAPEAPQSPSPSSSPPITHGQMRFFCSGPTLLASTPQILPLFLLRALSLCPIPPKFSS